MTNTNKISPSEFMKRLNLAVQKEIEDEKIARMKQECLELEKHRLKRGSFEKEK